MRPSEPAAILLVLGALLVGCVDLGEPPQTTVIGRLTGGPGVVFIERGPIYEGSFERAATIGEDGRFTVEMSSSGPHGFHAYLDGYIYLPIAIDLEAGVPNRITQSRVDWDFLCESAGMCDWVDQPEDPDVLAAAVDPEPADNPVIGAMRVVRAAPGTVQISVEVTDPQGDLSNQILAHHVESGIGVALNAPGPVVDGNFPNGTYTATVFVPEDAPMAGRWQIVAADHTCSNSPIVGVTETTE